MRSSIFARKKYAQEVPWIKSDKSQMRRFCSDKERMIMKIKQLEVPLGRYRQHQKEGEPVVIPQQSLALYCSPNPRDLWRATFTGIKRFATLIETNGRTPSTQQECSNIHQEAMSCIQQSCSRKVRVPFDLDTEDKALVEECINNVEGKCDVLKTRGGYHIFVYPAEISKDNKAWYGKFAEHADVKGDNLMPVPGCYQGGFVPRFVFRKEYNL